VTLQDCAWLSLILGMAVLFLLFGTSFLVDWRRFMTIPHTQRREVFSRSHLAMLPLLLGGGLTAFGAHFAVFGVRPLTYPLYPLGALMLSLGVAAAICLVSKWKLQL
jgi:hypothetical protein